MANKQMGRFDLHFGGKTYLLGLDTEDTMIEIHRNSELGWCLRKERLLWLPSSSG